MPHYVVDRNKLTRLFPRADFLIAVGRIVTNYPALIILAYPTFVLCSIPEAVFILSATWAITLIGRRTAVACRDGLGLTDLLKDILKNGATIYKVDDYFPGGLPAECLRGLEIITPLQRILRIPGRISYEAFQYRANESFVLVPFEPSRSNPTRLYCLLHELGHIGRRNYLGANSGRISAMQALYALVPLLIFASPSSRLSYIVIWALSWAVLSTNNNLRIEAEIEADHSALFQLMLFRKMHEPDGPFSRSGLDPLTNDDIGEPAADRNMLSGDNYVRKEIFKIMREHAKQGKLASREAYMWMADWTSKCIAILWSILVLCAAYFMSFEDIGIGWVSAVFLLSLVLFSLFILLWRHSALLEIEKLLKSPAHTT